MLKTFTTVAALVLLGCSLPAHADPVPYAFNSEGDYPSVAVDGTFQYDATDGSVSGGSLGILGEYLGFTGTSQYESIYLIINFNGVVGGYGDVAEIVLDIANPAAPTVCVDQGSCPLPSRITEFFDGSGSNGFDLTSGTLTLIPPPPPPPTPEPSSWLLLATGGVALLYASRRRILGAGL